MTAPSASQVSGDQFAYPVYTLQADSILLQISYHSADADQEGDIGGSYPTVESTESFLEAMAAWAHGTYGATTVTLNKVTQSESNLYTS